MKSANKSNPRAETSAGAGSSEESTSTATHTKTGDGFGGPVSVAWREGTLTRAKELESLTAWLGGDRVPPQRPSVELCEAIKQHLAAARQAAGYRGKKIRFRRGFNGPLLERAMSNLDAAEADLLQVAPTEYVLGQMPSLLNQVQRTLAADDPRRLEFERIAASHGIGNPVYSSPNGNPNDTPADQQALADTERNKIVSIARGASSAALRSQLRIRNFRNVIIATTVAMMLLAVGLAVLGLLSPATVPLCFQPERAGQTVVVCPTGQSEVVPTGTEAGPAQPDIDVLVAQTAGRLDLVVIMLLGLLAASVSAAATIRRLRGSSEPHDLPVALAALKLPTGAVTAVLGLLLVRGEFVPGLSALDTSGQILAWAVIFGYAQLVFTRFVDQQAQTVLDKVRPGEEAAPTRHAPTGST